MSDSRFVGIIVGAGRRIAAVWRRLEEIDRAAEQSRVEPDCAYGRATALVADSALARAIAGVADRWNPDGSIAVAAAAAVARRVRQLAPWQRVRLAGIAFTTVLVVHAALFAVLPWRLGPRLPAVAWIAAAAFGLTLLVAAREVVAAWHEWKR